MIKTVSARCIMNLLAVIYHSRTRMDIEHKSSSAASRPTLPGRLFFTSASHTPMHGSGFHFYFTVWSRINGVVQEFWCPAGSTAELISCLWLRLDSLEHFTESVFRALNAISCVLAPRLSLLWRFQLSDIEFSVGNCECMQNQLNQKCNRRSNLKVRFYFNSFFFFPVTIASYFRFALI